MFLDSLLKRQRVCGCDCNLTSSRAGCNAGGGAGCNSGGRASCNACDGAGYNAGDGAGRNAGGGAGCNIGGWAGCNASGEKADINSSKTGLAGAYKKG